MTVGGASYGFAVKARAVIYIAVAALASAALAGGREQSAASAEDLARDTFALYCREICGGEAPKAAFRVDPALDSRHDEYAVRSRDGGLAFSGANGRALLYAVYDFLARTVCRLLTGAALETGIRQALIAGGVASSALLREMVTARTARAMPDMSLYFGRPEYSGDNAVGIALIGAEKLRAAGRANV